MYNFLVHNQLYVVLIVVIVVWIGIAYALIRIERKVDRLEKVIEKSSKIE